MTIQIKKFCEILTSRPAGREAALAFLAHNQEIKNSNSVKLDFDGVLVMTPSWLSEFVQTLQDKGVTGVTFMPSQNPTVTSSIEFILPEVRSS